MIKYKGSFLGVIDLILNKIILIQHFFKLFNDRLELFTSYYLKHTTLYVFECNNIIIALFLLYFYPQNLWGQL